MPVFASGNFTYVHNTHAMHGENYKAMKDPNGKQMKPSRKELFSSHRLSPPLILPRRIDRVQLKFKFLITIPFRATNSTSFR